MQQMLTCQPDSLAKMAAQNSQILVLVQINLPCPKWFVVEIPSVSAATWWRSRQSLQPHLKSRRYKRGSPVGRASVCHSKLSSRQGRERLGLSHVSSVVEQVSRDIQEAASSRYWKDLVLLMVLGKEIPGEELVLVCLQILKDQWQKDIAALSRYKLRLRDASEAADTLLGAKIKKAGPQISLMAKRLPREGHGVDKSDDFVDRFASLGYCADGISPTAASANGAACDAVDSWKSRYKAQYRKQVAELTSVLALPEICSQHNVLMRLSSSGLRARQPNF